MKRGIVDDAGGMDGGVDLPEARLAFGNRSPHRLRVGRVDGHDEHRTSGCFNRLNALDSRHSRVARIESGNKVGPILSRRETRSANQDKPGLRGARQSFCKSERDSTQTTRDQHDPVASQTPCLSAFSKWPTLVRFHEAIAIPQGNSRLRGLSLELGRQQASEHLG